MDRRGDHESVIAGGRYGNRPQRASQPLAATRRERQWQTSVQSRPLFGPRAEVWHRGKHGIKSSRRSLYHALRFQAGVDPGEQITRKGSQSAHSERRRLNWGRRCWRPRLRETSRIEQTRTLSKDAGPLSSAREWIVRAAPVWRAAASAHQNLPEHQDESR